jgi:hypothetical protein
MHEQHQGASKHGRSVRLHGYALGLERTALYGGDSPSPSAVIAGRAGKFHDAPVNRNA